jgi:hypothetical protein
VRKGTKLLFRRPRKRFLVQRSIEQDLALTFRAHREQEENVAEEGRINNARSRFLLTRDRILFAAKILVTLLSIAALAVALITKMEPAAVVASFGGTVGGSISLLFRSGSE